MYSFLEKRKIIVLLGVISISIFLILFRFLETPKVWLDEGVFSEIARNFALHGKQEFQIAPNTFFPMYALSTCGYPLILPISASYLVFGTGLWQSRLPMILYMMLLLILYYLVTNKKYGFSTGILSVLGLVTYAPFYGNGRTVLGEVPGLTFLMLGIYFLIKLEESLFQDGKAAFFAGLALGVSAATKPIFLLILLVVLPFALLLYKLQKYAGVKDVNLPKRKIFLAVAGGFLLPLIFWIYIQFPSREALSTIIPLYKHLISNHEAKIPLTQTLAKNLLRFVTESTPILFTLLFGTIVSYMAWTVIKFKKTFSISEYVIVLFIGVNFAAYLVGTGWYRYLFPAQALLFVLFPAAMLGFSNLVNNRKLSAMIALIPGLLIAVQLVQLIFVSDVSFTVRRNRNQELARVLSEVTPDKSILFYNTIEAIVFIKGSNYSQYLRVGDSLDTGNKDAIDHPTADYVLITSVERPNLMLRCYDRSVVDSGKYYFFTKRQNCAK